MNLEVFHVGTCLGIILLYSVLLMNIHIVRNDNRRNVFEKLTKRNVHVQKFNFYQVFQHIELIRA